MSLALDDAAIARGDLHPARSGSVVSPLSRRAALAVVAGLSTAGWIALIVAIAPFIG